MVNVVLALDRRSGCLAWALDEVPNIPIGLVLEHSLRLV